MENNIYNLETKIREFFNTEVTLSDMMAEVEEAVRVFFNAVSSTNGTTQALLATNMLLNVSKLLDLLGDEIND